MDERLIIPLIFIFTSLLSITLSFRYYVHYRVLVLNRTFQRVENRRRYRAALSVLGLSAVVFVAALFTLISGANRASRIPVEPGLTAAPPVQQAQTTTPGAVLSSPAAESTPGAPSGDLPAPSETPTASVRLARIGNTGGFGANIRTAPSLDSEIIATLMDDVQVTLMEDAQEAGGYTWQRIILDDGQQGWVADTFLIPEN